jgi:D-alanyl-D-alanine carboxypeptidase
MTPAQLLGQRVAGIPNADTATIDHLLSHTSGIPSWEDDPSWIRDGRGEALDVLRIWGKEDALAYIRGHAPLFAAGERYAYSNTNHTLLGLIIEHVTQRAATAEIRNRILEPLALRSIYMEGFEKQHAAEVPQRYHWATSEFRTQAGVNARFPEMRADMIDVSASNLSVEWTAGGMVSSARDLALFGSKLRVGELLSEGSMQLMTHWRSVAEGRCTGRGLSRKELAPGLIAIGHDGNVLGFSGSLYWLDDADIVIATLSNAGSMHAGTVPNVISMKEQLSKAARS